MYIYILCMLSMCTVSLIVYAHSTQCNMSKQVDSLFIKTCSKELSQLDDPPTPIGIVKLMEQLYIQLMYVYTYVTAGMQDQMIWDSQERC